MDRNLVHLPLKNQAEIRAREPLCMSVYCYGTAAHVRILTRKSKAEIRKSFGNSDISYARLARVGPLGPCVHK